MSVEETVHVVDDDPSVRLALDTLFRSAGLKVATHPGASEFLAAVNAETATCLVLDVRMPSVGGLELQAEIARRDLYLPIVFMTGHGDVPVSVAGMKAGAVDFLVKPVAESLMLATVLGAIEEGRGRRARRHADENVLARYGTLSPRERQVMDLVTQGKMNKQVAAELALSEITVKIYRGGAMRKMKVRSLPDLVRSMETIRAIEPVRITHS